MESINDFFSLITSDYCRLLDLLFRLIINTLFSVIIARKFYFPKSRRVDFFFTYILVGFGIFMLIHLMGDAKLKTGIAMGLFRQHGKRADNALAAATRYGRVLYLPHDKENA